MESFLARPISQNYYEGVWKSSRAYLILKSSRRLLKSFWLHPVLKKNVTMDAEVFQHDQDNIPTSTNVSVVLAILSDSGKSIGPKTSKHISIYATKRVNNVLTHLVKRSTPIYRRLQNRQPVL